MKHAYGIMMHKKRVVKMGGVIKGKMIMDELYKQEILELTELFRKDEDWEDLREILAEKGFDLFDIALVSFEENEEEIEYGVIVKKNMKVKKYSRTKK